MIFHTSPQCKSELVSELLWPFSNYTNGFELPITINETDYNSDFNGNGIIDVTPQELIFWFTKPNSSDYTDLEIQAEYSY